MQNMYVVSISSKCIHTLFHIFTILIAFNLIYSYADSFLQLWTSEAAHSVSTETPSRVQ